MSGTQSEGAVTQAPSEETEEMLTYLQREWALERTDSVRGARCEGILLLRALGVSSPHAVRCPLSEGGVPLLDMLTAGKFSRDQFHSLHSPIKLIFTFPGLWALSPVN